MKQEQKHYFAFVSHSSADEKTALWLREQLENYHIPSIIQRDYDAPKQLKPVFVYQTDLAGLNLKESLHKSLTDSQFLIVVCSPSAAKSEYVNGEVQHFIDTGRADKIIPFIIAGTPYVSISGHPSDECFPPALISLKNTEQEQRGVNLPEMEQKTGSRKAAVVNIIASMLGVRFDTLWDRYRRRRIRQYGIAAALTLLAVLAGLFVWDYNRPAYRYFADYVDKWGVPEGIIELTKEQQRHRHRMYQFEYRRIPFGEPNAYSWRVAKVSYVNSARVPMYNDNEYCINDRNLSAIIDITYSKQDGVPTQWIFSNNNGKVRLRQTLSEWNGIKAAVADFVSAKETQGVGYLSQSQNWVDNAPTIVRYVYERDHNGYIVKQTFHANNDYNIRRSITHDAQGVYGYTYVLDSLGRHTKVLFVDKNGETISNKKGVAGQNIAYDVYGNRSRITYIDLQGEPIGYNEYYDNIAAIAYSSNTNGNIEEIFYLDMQGELCYGKSRNYAKEIMRYDEHGNRIEMAFYEADGNPCETIWFGHKRVEKYNKKGFCIEETYYGADGQLYLTNSGARTKYIRDKQGHCIEWANYGTDGLLYGGSNGIAICRTKYDSEGNVIESAFYDTQDKLSIWDDVGYAKSTSKYDELGNMTEYAFFGNNDQLCLRSLDHIAKICQKHDDRGNLIELSCFDTEGNPCIATDELYACMKMEYDDNGNNIETSYYGIDGKASYCIRGYYKVINEFDEQGNNINSSYFGTDNLPCLNADSIAGWVAQYDDRGNEIETSYFGIDGKPCMHKEGFSKLTARYDERGNCTEKVFYDTKGKMCKNIEGVAKWVSKYDKYGNETEIAFYGTDNRLISTDAGAIRRQKYNMRGDVTEVRYFDINDKPCLNNQGYAILRHKYDNFGNITEEAFFDVNDKPVLSDEGVAKITIAYNAQGKETERAFYGVDGEPCMLPDGNYHKRIIQYDGFGNDIEYAYYDINNDLCLMWWGIAKWTSMYDDRGNEIERTYYDATNNPCVVDGFSTWKKRYDNRNQIVEASYYGLDGNLCMITDEELGIRYARYTREYDERGEMINETHYDTKGNSIQ